MPTCCSGQIGNLVDRNYKSIKDKTLGIKLISVGFDIYIANITHNDLHTCSLNTCLCCVKILSLFLYKHLRYEHL